MKNTVRFSHDAYTALCSTVGNYQPETGSIIAGPAGDPTYITHTWFDAGAGQGKIVYTPSAAQICDVVQRWMREDNCCFSGVVHSHGDAFPSLSSVDLHSANIIMHRNRLPFLYLGLFHRGKLSMFKVLPGRDATPGTVKKLNIIVDPPTPTQT